MKQVKVDLFNKSYYVNIGSDIFAKCMNSILPGSKNHIFIVDKNVDIDLGEYENIIKLDKSSEDIKTISYFGYIAEKIMNSYSINRSTVIVAIGGGSVGDLSGFLASVMLRGIRYIHVPTTLLAMADSSIGGKTGINSSKFKNMIGSFHQPINVICDLSFLNSCDDRDWRSGYAEIFKHAIIDDKYALFDTLTTNQDKFNQKNHDYISQILEISCKIKRDIVQDDEFETKGIRELLNFGHTICHGIEKLDSLNHIIRHGEAVAIGMIIEMKLAQKMSILKDESLLKKAIDHINSINMSCDLKEFCSCHGIEYSKDNIVNSMIEIMKKDKKNTSDHIKFILPSNIGKFEKIDIGTNDIKKCLIELL